MDGSVRLLEGREVNDRRAQHVVTAYLWDNGWDGSTNVKWQWKGWTISLGADGQDTQAWIDDSVFSLSCEGTGIDAILGIVEKIKEYGGEN